MIAKLEFLLRKNAFTQKNILIFENNASKQYGMCQRNQENVNLFSKLTANQTSGKAIRRATVLQCCSSKTDYVKVKN